MPPSGEDARGLASMFASRADHDSVTADRLSGSADAVSGLRTPVVGRLVRGEEPKFLFDADEKGVGIGGPEATVSPDRGGVFLFTDLRVCLVVGVGDEDKTLSLAYESVSSASYHRAVRRHRVELAFEGTSYHLWTPTKFDRDAVERAVEYATYRHKQETPDTGGDGMDSEETASDSQSQRERLERLGEAHARAASSTPRSSSAGRRG
ncbi:hypothetical protein [Halorussus amylolyticus]|uniref:hypothetical protein n=1 Tax=Halorussus amylolyticus TaxID=1126242 RepID=UPI0010455E8A|nr:hypothetical protein [Halorussus amylolyticus]